jgi:hypothetical protein
MSDIGTPRERLPGPEYVTNVTFDAPIDYVFRWCTDYTPNDPKLGGRTYARRVVERGPDRVVFEDLDELPKGWSWAHYTVTLFPPDHWHMDSIGSHRHAVGDYTLRSEPGDRTRFELRYRREPGLLPFERIPKAERDPDDLALWTRWKRALEREYRASRRGRARR